MRSRVASGTVSSSTPFRSLSPIRIFRTRRLLNRSQAPKMDHRSTTGFVTRKFWTRLNFRTFGYRLSFVFGGRNLWRYIRKRLCKWLKLSGAVIIVIYVACFNSNKLQIRKIQFLIRKVLFIHSISCAVR